MDTITAPLRCLLGFGFRQISLVPALLTRLEQAAGGTGVFPVLDGPMLLAEASLNFRTRGWRGFPLLVLAAGLMALLLLVLLPLLRLGCWTASFLETHPDEVGRQNASPKRSVTPASVLLLALVLATFSLVYP